METSIRNPYFERMIIAVKKIMETTPNMTVEEMFQQIRDDTLLSAKTKELLFEYSKNDTKHYDVTFKDLLLHVWSIIVNHEQTNTIKVILDLDIQDTVNRSFKTHFSRLINCVIEFYL